MGCGHGRNQGLDDMEPDCRLLVFKVDIRS